MYFRQGALLDFYLFIYSFFNLFFLKQTDTHTHTHTKSWLHLQLNENCSPLDAVLVWNAVNSGGTTNLPQAAFSLDPAYNAVAFVTPLPAPAPSNWVLDFACAARCGINVNSIPVGNALRSKLQQTARLVFSGEQVAAADATALFGQGAESVLKKDAQLAAAAARSAAASAKNATRAAVGVVG